VDQLRLQLLQAGLRLLALGKVANEAGEEAPLSGAHLAHGELHREGGAVFALADDDAADADDPPLAGRQVALHVSVVAFAIGRGHQHLHVLAQRFRRRIAEKPLRRAREGLHDAGLVDHDHRFGNGVQNRA